MFEFLLNNSNTENPTELSILITVLFAFFLSSLIVITYELTTKNVNRPANYLQSVALISIVAATIMQAIGDSLARGLGMLGALAIIRFRTKLDDPRNITFMFASIAAGIACGVFGFTTAFIGTIGFCCAAFIIKFSPLGDDATLVGNLRIRIAIEGSSESILIQIIKKYCRQYELQEVRLILLKTVEAKEEEARLKAEAELNENSELENLDTKNASRQVDDGERLKYKELAYEFRIKNRKHIVEFSDEIEAVPEARGIRLRFGKQRISL